MVTPCPRCGHTKTESVRHGFIYNKLWDMGYHLRRCSFCERLRIFKRSRNQRHPDDWTAEELTAHFNRKIAEAKGKLPVVVKGYAETMNPNSTEKPGERGAGRNAVAVDVAEETDDYRLCPRCGSTIYRRSRRRWWEKLIGRPRMARCLKCNHRFPYPH